MGGYIFQVNTQIINAFLHINVFLKLLQAELFQKWIWSEFLTRMTSTSLMVILVSGVSKRKALAVKRHPIDWHFLCPAFLCLGGAYRKTAQLTNASF